MKGIHATCVVFHTFVNIQPTIVKSRSTHAPSKLQDGYVTNWEEALAARESFASASSHAIPWRLRPFGDRFRKTTATNCAWRPAWPLAPDHVAIERSSWRS